MKITCLLAAIAMIAAPLTVKAADPTPKPYPLTTCFISGEKLGEMGKPVVFTYEGQEIKLCCKDCKKQFDKDPAAAMKKFNEAAAGSKSSGHSMSNM
ncbi:MAG TPA: hypothetical protein VIM61_01600 [Chthoniobacterales bacterium]|jgi:hypothetical protein